MNVTPKVYYTNPGGRTVANMIAAINKVVSANPVHWEVVLYTVAPPSYQITLQCKRNPLMWLFLSTTTISTNGYANLSLDGGASYNPTFVRFQGGGGETLSGTTYGCATDLMYVVQVEDAFMFYTTKTLTGGGGSAILLNALGMSIVAGSLVQTHNRSDADYGITNKAILGGLAGLSPATAENTFCLSTNTDATNTTTSRVYWGSWDKIGYLNARTSAAETASVGDGQSTERLVPIPVMGTTGTTGHPGYLKYMRARNVFYDGASVTNETVIASPFNPSTIGWRHNKVTSTSPGNTVVIWCPPGQEVNVP